jgi:cytochrome c biogenesis protein
MLKRVLDFFASVRLTITLLILVSAASLIGTLVVQNKSPQEYREIYGPVLSNLIRFTGATDLYHSWYFQFLLALLSLNLTVCTLERLPRIWRRIRNERAQFPAHLPEKSPFQARAEVAATLAEAMPVAEQTLKSGFSQVQVREAGDDRIFFAARGSLSLLGPYLTHLAILVIIAGTLIGSFLGFKGFLPLHEGQSADRAQNELTGVPIPLPFSVRCERFTLETYPETGQPKSYKSLLTIMQNGKEILRQEIAVNHPLRYQGVSFYQASYGQDSAIRLVATKVSDGSTIGREVAVGEALKIPGEDFAFVPAEYLPSMSGMGMDMGPTLLVQKVKGDQVLQEFKLFSRHPNFDRERQDAYLLRFTAGAAGKWTGLQVVQDPGVPVIWTGCILMMLGIYFSFFIYHRRVWVRLRPVSNKKILVEVFGQTRKTAGRFEKQVAHLAQTLAEKLKQG